MNRHALGEVLTSHFKDDCRPLPEGWVVRWGTSAVVVSWNERRTGDVVRLRTRLLAGARDEPQLYEHIATQADGHVFGHLSCERVDNGVDVFSTHNLLADFLAGEELTHCVEQMCRSSDIDDGNLARAFGGETLAEWLA